MSFEILMRTIHCFVSCLPFLIILNHTNTPLSISFKETKKNTPGFPRLYIQILFHFVSFVFFFLILFYESKSTSTAHGFIKVHSTIFLLEREKEDKSTPGVLMWTGSFYGCVAVLEYVEILTFTSCGRLFGQGSLQHL